jgi:putative hemolysin
MDLLVLAIIISMILLVSLSALFSASEIAYSSLNQIRLKNMVAEGVKKADVALDNWEHFDKILTTVLVGNNIVNIAASTLCTMLFTILFGDAYGVLLATAFMITVLLIFGEITPKTLAKRNPEKFAIKVANIIRFTAVVLSPMIWAFLAITRSMTKRGEKKDSPTLTEDELYFMIDEIQEEGTIEKRESDLIKSAILFDDITVSEIYTPRVDITAVDIRTDVEDMRRLFIESEYSRIPVFDMTIDRIIGVVYSKDFYSRYVNGKEFKLTDVIRPVRFVPESMSIATLLNDLQRSKLHMAVVLDNYGGTVGIVCLEDILEELVGEIWDENDEVKIPVVKMDDGSYTVLGEADMAESMREMGLEFKPEEGFSGSVSGFIHHSLQKIPHKGDSIELDNVTIVVSTMKSRRIKEARFIPRNSLGRIGSA